MKKNEFTKFLVEKTFQISDVNTLSSVVILFFIFMFSFTSLQALVMGDLSCLEKLEPGDSKRIKVTLNNDKDQEALIELKLCDYSCNTEGQHFFDPIGTQERSNASWIHLNTPRITLGPKEVRDVYLSIEVPKNETLKGSYWTVLMIEPSDPVQVIKGENDGLQLNVKVRYAYHIVTTVGGGTAKLNILQKEFKKIEDQNYFSVSVANTGDLFLNPKLILKLYGTDGKIEKTLEGKTERLYPGNSQRYLVDIKGVPVKKYTAFLMLDNGDKQLFADTFDLEIP